MEFDVGPLLVFAPGPPSRASLPIWPRGNCREAAGTFGSGSVAVTVNVNVPFAVGVPEIPSLSGLRAPYREDSGERSPSR